MLIVRGSRPERYQARDASSSTGFPAPILDTPRSIQVITEQVLLDQQAQDMRDVLRNASGVQTRNISGGTTDAFVMRGFEVQNILQDGFQLDRNSQRVQTANIERVEVVKGPNAILLGQSQPGGVINVITKKPRAESRRYLHSNVDEFGRRELMIDLTGSTNTSGSLRYRVVGSTERSKLFRRTDRAAEVARDILAPSLTWLATPDTELTFALEFVESEIPFDEGTVALEDSDGQLFVPDVGRSVRFGENKDRNETSQTTARLSLSQRLSDSWAATAMASALSSDVTSFSNAPLLALPDGTLLRQQQQFEPELDRLLLGAQLLGELELFGLEQSIVLGVDHNRREFYSEGSFGSGISSINIFDPRYGASPPDLTPATVADTEVRQTGIYLQSLLSLSEAFRLSLGVRVDDFEREGFFSFMDNPSDRNLDSNTEPSPNVGLVYKPSEFVSLFASYSESFDPNAASINQVTGEAVTPDPSEGEQWELGVKGSFLSERLFFNLAYFDITRTNIPFGVDQITGVTLLNGEEQSQGVEFDLTLQFIDGLSLLANYASIDAVVTEGTRAGNTARNVPDHAANLWITYEVQGGSFQGLGIGGGATYVGERFVDAGNTFLLPSYTTVDLTSFYFLPVAPATQMRLQLGVRNLFDEEFLTPNSNIRTLGVGQPRTVYGSISLEF